MAGTAIFCAGTALLLGRSFPASPAPASPGATAIKLNRRKIANKELDRRFILDFSL
jgi:hypothetical protein